MSVAEVLNEDEEHLYFQKDALQWLQIVADELLRLPLADKMSIFSALRYLPFAVFQGNNVDGLYKSYPDGSVDAYR